MALTGVGLLPIIMLISAFAAFAGMGGAPAPPPRLGAGNRDSAEHNSEMDTMSLILASGVFLTIVFTVFKLHSLYAFKTSNNIIGYAEEYIGIYLIGTIFVQISLGLNTFISTPGRATTAMLSVLIGAIIICCT